MAGLTKAEIAGKAAYLASSDPPPETAWTDLSLEERQKWLDAVATPATPPALDSITADPKTWPPAPAEPMPDTDPAHGDLTPRWARWYLRTHGAKATAERYTGRLDKLPADVVSELGGTRSE